MKKVISLFCLIIIKVSLFGQEYAYVPMPDSNAIWSEVYYPPFDSGEPIVYHNWTLFNEDTIINTIKYHKLFELDDTALNRQKAMYIGAIREDTSKRIYYLGPMRYPHSLFPDSTTEFMLYDFSVNIGDTIKKGNFIYFPYLVVDAIDTITVSNGDLRKRIKFYGLPWLEWIEGIGNNMGLIFPSDDLPTNGMENNLICMFQNNELVYHYDEYDECFYTPTVIKNKEMTWKFQVYPNPVTARSYLDLNSMFANFEVFNISGIRLKVEKVAGLSQFSINKIDYGRGLYFYRLTSQDGNTCNGKFFIY